ncbi:MAG: hypothetical protein HC897_17565 [Thermoanaerobaculia bacterium]|nr:hypothetical protein [Thermoanaerobaculia bacterium]
MSAHAITLHLPDILLKRFQRRAEWSHRSLETELLDAVAAATPVEDELPAELLATIEGLEKLDDAMLWHLARETMPRQSCETLEVLNARHRDSGLNRAENAERSRLLHEHERTMLLRAQAASVLKSRGHDISGLLIFPS